MMLGAYLLICSKCNIHPEAGASSLNERLMKRKSLLIGKYVPRQSESDTEFPTFNPVR